MFYDYVQFEGSWRATENHSSFLPRCVSSRAAEQRKCWVLQYFSKFQLPSRPTAGSNSGSISSGVEVCILRIGKQHPWLHFRKSTAALHHIRPWPLRTSWFQLSTSEGLPNAAIDNIKTTWSSANFLRKTCFPGTAKAILSRNHGVRRPWAQSRTPQTPIGCTGSDSPFVRRKKHIVVNVSHEDRQSWSRWGDTIPTKPRGSTWVESDSYAATNCPDLYPPHSLARWINYIPLHKPLYQSGTVHLRPA